MKVYKVIQYKGVEATLICVTLTLSRAQQMTEIVPFCQIHELDITKPSKQLLELLSGYDIETTLGEVHIIPTK